VASNPGCVVGFGARSVRLGLRPSRDDPALVSPSVPGLRARLFHANINCSDLDRSLAFYRDTVGLTPLVRTTPAHPQPGDAFGLEVAQWDAWILAGAHGLDGVVVDLLEWKTPRPGRGTGEPGFRRLRLGVAPGGALTPGSTVDPDGTPLEIVADASPRVAGVEIGCSALERSRAFYRDVVGLAPVVGSVFADRRGPEAFTVELIESPGPIQPRAANDLGIYRLALLTDDIDTAYRALLAAGVRTCSPPATLDMGPGLPRLRALLFPDLDGTMLELIESPPPAPPATAGDDERR
jgi:catechol 2,3-dioxygenase-like lactoylglutathione lyase family enzyme